MARTRERFEPTVELTPEESLSIREFRDSLDALGANGHPVLALPSGGQIPLPNALLRVLTEAAGALAGGAGRVFIVREEQDLTTSRAAGLLGISRPHLIQLLERKHIPYRWVGSHRRIPLDALLVYKQAKEKRAEEAFQEMVDLSEEVGFYDADETRESATDRPA